MISKKNLDSQFNSSKEEDTRPQTEENQKPALSSSSEVVESSSDEKAIDSDNKKPQGNKSKPHGKKTHSSINASKTSASAVKKSRLSQKSEQDGKKTPSSTDASKTSGSAVKKSRLSDKSEQNGKKTPSSTDASKTTGSAVKKSRLSQKSEQEGKKTPSSTDASKTSGSAVKKSIRSNKPKHDGKKTNPSSHEKPDIHLSSGKTKKRVKKINQDAIVSADAGLATQIKPLKEVTQSNKPLLNEPIKLNKSSYVLADKEVKETSLLTWQEVEAILAKENEAKPSKKSVQQVLSASDLELLVKAGYKASEIENLVNLGITPLVLRRLNDSETTFSVEDSSQCITTCIEMGRERAEKARGQDLLFVIGNTGAGKSTAINYLLGCQMARVDHLGMPNERGRNIGVHPDSLVPEQMPIGHSLSVSKTFIPSLSTLQVGALTVCDAPGYEDTRGTEISIANAINSKNALKNARTLRILVLIDYRITNTGRGKGITELRETLEQLFDTKDISQYAESIMIGLSHVPLVDANFGSLLSAEEVLENFYENDAGLPKSLIENTMIVDPLNRRDHENFSKNDWVKRLSALSPMDNHQELFKTVLKAEDKLMLVNLSARLSTEVEQAFKESDYLKGYNKIQQLDYLRIIDHKSIETLYQKQLKELSAYVETKTKEIDSAITKYDFKNAQRALKDFSHLVAAFEEVNPKLKHQLKSLLESYHQKVWFQLSHSVNNGLKELKGFFYEHSTSNLSLVTQWYKRFCVTTPQIVDKNAVDYLDGFLSVLAEIEPINQRVVSLRASLCRAFSVSEVLGKKTSFYEMETTCIQELAEITQNASDLYTKFSQDELVKLRALLFEDLAKLQKAIIENNIGKEVLEKLKCLTTFDNATKTMDDLSSLKPLLSISSVVDNILINADKALSIIQSLPKNDKNPSEWHAFIHSSLLTIKKEHLVQQTINELVEVIKLDDAKQQESQSHQLVDKISHFDEGLINALKKDLSVNSAWQAVFQKKLNLLESQLSFDKTNFVSYLNYFEDYPKQATLSTVSDWYNKLPNEQGAVRFEGLDNVINLFGLLINLESRTYFEINSALDTANQTFASLYKKLQVAVTVIGESEKNKRVEQLIIEINTLFIPNAQFNKVREALDLVAQLAPEKLKLVTLKSEVDIKLSDFRESISAKEYKGAASSYVFIKQVITSVGIEMLKQLDIEVNTEPMIKTINDVLEALQKAIAKEVLEAFDEERLDDNNKPLSNLKENKKFFDALKHFSSTTNTSHWEKVTQSALESVFQIIFKRYKSNADAQTMARFLVQGQLLATDVGANIPALTTSIKKHTLELLDNMDDAVVYRTGIALKAILTQGIDYSPMASRVINNYDHFAQAQRRILMGKMAGRSASNILSELKLVNTDRLTLVYDHFAKEYDSLMAKVIANHQKEIETNDFYVRNEAINDAKTIALKLKTTNDFYQSPDKVAIMLANIFIVWAHLDAHRVKFNLDKSGLSKPHASQVISILLMLGMDTTEAMKNHLLEVHTGEGKSVIAAGTSLFFALLGYAVDVGCYNPYLAKRDKNAFAELFGQFQLDGSIQYGDIKTLTESYIKNNFGNVRQAMAKFISGEKDKLVSYGKDTSYKRLLFIDEVDVFFSKDFLGHLQGAATSIRDDHYIKLLMGIWNEKDSYLKLNKADFFQKVEATEPFQHFMKAHPKLHFLKGKILSDIHKGFMNMANEQHEYVVYKKQIAYKDDVSNSFRTNIHGSATPFAAIKEYLNKRIDDAELKDKVCLTVSCGHFSYAEMPKVYDFIVGVSGTMTTLSSYEQKLIKEEYAIHRQTIIPSVFTKQNKNLKDGAEVFAGDIDEKDTGYFANIRKQVDQYVASDRAALVVFETKERMDAYKAYVETHPYKAPSARQSELDTVTASEKRDLIIEEAAMRGKVTLMVRQFGRGSDFVCHDSAIRDKGGVAVICTFFPKTKAEEIQIKGRTWRQNDPGTFKMLLFFDDLKSNFNVNTQDEMGLTEVDCYKYLTDIRIKMNDQEDNQTQNKVARAKATHDKTLSMVKHLITGNRGFFSKFTSSPQFTDEDNQVIEGFISKNA